MERDGVKPMRTKKFHLQSRLIGYASRAMKLPFILARRFVAGRTAAEALPVVERFNRNQIHVTMDLLGEEVTEKRVAAETIERYSELMRLIESEGLLRSLSVKLITMGLLMNAIFCRDSVFR